MTINQRLVPDKYTGKTNPGTLMKSINFITVHTTGNTTPAATAKMHADYQYNGAGGRQASWHK